MTPSFMDSSSYSNSFNIKNSSNFLNIFHTGLSLKPVFHWAYFSARDEYTGFLLDDSCKSHEKCM